jgi:hypothetical protein
MRTKTTAYFITGFIFQLIIIINFIYWYTLLSAHKPAETMQLYTSNFPAYLQDKRILMLIVALLAIVSMLCYGMAKKLSIERKFRNLITGLILADAIVLIVIAIGLI